MTTEKHEDLARVEPSVHCVEPTGSTAEDHSGVVTDAERTEPLALVRCVWKCGECRRRGTVSVFRYANESNGDLALRHSRETQRVCVVGCNYFAMPAALRDAPAPREETKPQLTTHVCPAHDLCPICGAVNWGIAKPSDAFGDQ